VSLVKILAKCSFEKSNANVTYKIEAKTNSEIFYSCFITAYMIDFLLSEFSLLRYLFLRLKPKANPTNIFSS